MVIDFTNFRTHADATGHLARLNAGPAYRVGDSVSNIITPLLPYFPLVVVLLSTLCEEHRYRYSCINDVAVQCGLGCHLDYLPPALLDDRYPTWCSSQLHLSSWLITAPYNLWLKVIQKGAELFAEFSSFLFCAMVRCTLRLA